jgi:hypothetical protein
MMATTMQTDVAVLCEAIYRDPSDLAAYSALADELESRRLTSQRDIVLEARNAVLGGRLIPAKYHGYGRREYTVVGAVFGYLSVYCEPATGEGFIPDFLNISRVAGEV